MNITTSTGAKYETLPENLKSAVDAAFNTLPMAGHHFMWGTYFPDGMWLTVYDWHFQEGDHYGTISSSSGHSIDLDW